MPSDNGFSPKPPNYYALYDVISDEKKDWLGNFTSLDGGVLEISMVSYNLAFEDGGSTTRYVPGQTSFSPITLSRVIDANYEAIYMWFTNNSSGKVKPVRKNISVAMIDYDATPMLVWNLINAVPIRIGGFIFNQERATGATSLSITIQPESIEVDTSF